MYYSVSGLIYLNVHKNIQSISVYIYAFHVVSGILVLGSRCKIASMQLPDAYPMLWAFTKGC